MRTETAWTLCVRCDHHWLAVFPDDEAIAECPHCGVFAGIPDPLNLQPRRLTLLDRIMELDPPAEEWIAAHERADREIAAMRNARIDPARALLKE
jgi:hypothetical protein